PALPQAHWKEAPHAATRPLDRREKAADAERAERVDQKTHPHAPRRGCHQRVAERSPDAVVAEDVVGGVDAARGALDGGELRRKGAPTVKESLHLVAECHWRAGEPPRGARERHERWTHAVEIGRALLCLALARQTEPRPSAADHLVATEEPID